MESSICRVCLENGGDMVNIFEEPHETGVSIAKTVLEIARLT